jgi:hypothetical protein
VVGVIQFGGGVLLLLGLWVRLAAALAAGSVGGHLFLALLQGGFPEPLPGQAPLPGYELSTFLAFSLLALVIGGAGRLSIDAWRQRRRALRMKATTLLAPIRAGEEEGLRAVLAAIEDAPLANPFVRFGEDRLTHFARFVVLEDPEIGPRLLFAATHNGSYDDYVAEILRVSPGLDEIWGRCEGYTGRGGFPEFARAHRERTREPFYAFPYATVEDIRTRIAIRKTIEGFLDQGDVAAYLRDPGLGPFLALLATLSRPPSALARLLGRIGRFLRAVFWLIHQALLNLALWLAQQYAYLGTERVFSKVQTMETDPRAQRREIEHINRLQAFDDRFVQNQLTLGVTVRPGLLWRLLLAQYAAVPINRYGYPPGEIGGIFTIHAFHWVVIDGGRHGIFMSNYDGSMINYIGDFIDKLVWSLDVFFNNTYGYPPGGMRQVDLFSSWLLRHQLLAQVYYSAYPQETVLDVLRDGDIAAPLVDGFDRGTVEGWLQLL